MSWPRSRWVGALCASMVAGCSCDGEPPGGPCITSAECAEGEMCVDGACVAGGERCTTSAGCGAGEMCVDGRCVAAADGGGSCPDARRCGARCCVEGEVCVDGACVLDCGGRAPCSGTCCAEGQMCLDGACTAACPDPARLCGPERALCCADGEACLGDACIPLGEPCEFSEDCPPEAFCEPMLMRCVPRAAVPVCEFRPPPGVFMPVLACRWTPPPGDAFPGFEDVVMTPAVANLTDDNGDGVTDTEDIPDIVFVSFNRRADGCCTRRGIVRVVSGACNTDGTMTTLATLGNGDPWIDNSTGIAVGNLHPDTMPDEHPPEIVATFQNGGTIAWRRSSPDGTAWEVLWRNDEYITGSHSPGSGAAPSLADLDGDGAPEVIIGNVVLNGQTGALVWDGRVTVGPGAGIGNNAFLGPSSTVADLDLDGVPEVIAGNTVYDGRTGAERWSFTYTTANSSCGGRRRCDGYNGAANLDDDPEGEVVIVRLGEVFVLEHDGTLKRRVQIPRIDCGRNESGPPTVADFDGDGRPEIGTASADYYVVIDLDCTGSPLPTECDSDGILWKVPNHDCSSRVTGSSVFDFDGDGRAEVVYADEVSFRIFDGRTGAILFEDLTHRSNTRLEMPIVVDVDNDGKSEIIVPEPNERADAGGIDVWEDADNNWVRTRRIWNQHAYHVTNITEDGQVPRREEPNWLDPRLNNFRQNVQPAGLFDAPDLVVTAIAAACDDAGARISITVRNQGALGVAPGIAVYVTATTDTGMTFDVGVARTTTRLLPGNSETVVLTWTPPGGWTFRTFTVTAVADDDGTGRGAYNECDETNNAFTSEEVFGACVLG